jgi:glutaredoxin
VIYTRRLCHRCLPIVSLLESRRQRFGFTLDLIDIDSDPDLASRMGVGVPVLGADGVMWFRGGSGVPIVTINGKIRFRGAVNPVLLDRLLHAEAALASSEPTP